MIAGAKAHAGPAPGAIDAAEVRWGADGLVPGIVQDARDGRVLMLGYLDAEALAATLLTGEVHFHSRSRGRLWRKGETSGHVLRLVDVAVDCDADALLLRVDPVGPTCHRETRSCFDPDGAPADPAEGAALAHDAERSEPVGQGFAWLETLWSTISERVAENPEGSYTARLVAGGVDAVGRKVAEEATEVLLAAKDDAAAETTGSVRAGTADRLAEETADLLYHALVLLAERRVRPAAVVDVLRARHRP